jgi:pimeloyl-ACP methyl ester carboxylesterase
VKKLFVCKVAILAFIKCFAQLKPGFDLYEYQQLMYMSARVGDMADHYYAGIPAPIEYKKVYQSAVMGLDNLWDLWTANNKPYVISIRGTTTNTVSWMENFYAAMVPARGALVLSSDFTFDYELSSNPAAAVHAGWLIGTAFLVRDMLPLIDSLYKLGQKEFLIIGHSQGGGITYLTAAHFYDLQKKGILPPDIRFKSYGSAAPKPGNLYFAYEFEHLTRGGWAFNVVNAADWVPEVPISIQTLDDFNAINPFKGAKSAIKKQKLSNRLVLSHIYKKLDKPTRKAQRNYQKYLGDMLTKVVKKSFPEMKKPKFYSSNNYVRTGHTVLLYPDSAYHDVFKPESEDDVFIHHLHKPYLYLASKLKQ